MSILSNGLRPETVIEPCAAKTLKDLDFSAELLKQYNRALLLMESATHPDVPPNQQAQVLNSCTSIIQQIIKTQTDLYSAEKVKLLENTLLNTLKRFPHLQKDFMEAYLEAISHVE